MRTWRGALPLILAIAVLAVLVGAHGSGRHAGTGDGGASGAALGKLARARVTRVVDGDTIKVSLDGRVDTVRYIGIDTPEDVKPGTPVECFALRAAARNRSLVDGQSVVLRFDRNPRDRYGRLLAYVYRASDRLFVNAALVREGFARKDPFPDNHAHAPLFAKLDARARARHAGLWGRCGPAGVRAFPNL